MSRTTMNGKPVFEVPAKTVINFESGFRKKLLCDGPTFSAGTSCAYSCTYCYVEDIMRKQKPQLEKLGVTGEHGDIVVRRKDAAARAEEQLGSKLGKELARQKLTVYASPLVDVAANMELVRETVQICEVILRLTIWDIRLLSKSNLLPFVARDLVNTGRSDSVHRVVYGVSLGTLDDKLAVAFELDCPKPSARLRSLKAMQQLGLRTFGMVCPSLPQRDYDLFSMECAAAIGADRCEHVWAEVINLRGGSFAKTEAALLAAGYEWEADQLRVTSEDKSTAWEMYARATYLAHQRVFGKKLRFLQYASGERGVWWAGREGAVLL